MVFTLNLIFTNIGINLFLPGLKKVLGTFLIISICLFQVTMQYLYLGESEETWNTYTTKVRSEKISAHLSTYLAAQSFSILPVMAIIFFLESMLTLFIDEILKVFGK